MTDLAPKEDIEKIVGAQRLDGRHLGRAVSEQEQVYILHSVQCRDRHVAGVRDLRDCPFSRALDRGIDPGRWRRWLNQPVVLGMDDDGLLIPFPFPSPEG